MPTNVVETQHTDDSQHHDETAVIKAVEDDAAAGVHAKDEAQHQQEHSNDSESHG